MEEGLHKRLEPCWGNVLDHSRVDEPYLGLAREPEELTAPYFSTALMRPARASSMTQGMRSTRSVGSRW